jgi:hypothetical protein
MNRPIFALGLSAWLLTAPALPSPALAGAPGAVSDAGSSQADQVADVGRTPRGFGALLVAQGRDVYHDLQEASAAVRTRDPLALRLALHDARDKLRALGMPWEARALEAQADIIRADLGDETKQPDMSLWVPVQAELKQVLVEAPPVVKSAAQKGERQTAVHKLDLLVDAVEYKLAAFPLRQVREDVHSASRSAALATPDWKATGEAIKSALAQMRWVTRIESQGMLAAYYAVANAQALWEQDRRPQAVRHLTEAADDLASLPNVSALATQAREVARVPSAQGIDDLLSAVLKQVQSVQAEAARGGSAAAGGAS